MPTAMRATTRAKKPAPTLYKYISRVPVRHDLDISLEDSTEKLLFFLSEAQRELGHTPDPFEKELTDLEDAANAVRNELYRRAGAK